jgi:DNA-directed RNA polymerase subunit RPC12/RpoP
MKDDYADLPIEELPNKVIEVLAKEYLLTPTDMKEGKVIVHFNYTCEKCGQRCTFEDPNKLYPTGVCWRCGHETIIKKAGFALIITQ